MNTRTGCDEIEKTVGIVIGRSARHTITQDCVDRFAGLTGDPQWIHIDPARATSGPYGTKAAHGHFVVSLVPMLMSEAARVDRLTAAINYGSNKMRFPAPTPLGSQVRSTVEVVEVTRGKHGAQAIFKVTTERKGGDTPSASPRSSRS